MLSFVAGTGEMLTAGLRQVDRAIVALLWLARWLVLPVSFLLFAQWPLRDLVQAYSVQANDLAQWLFALYVSFALSFATRERAHLAADTFAHRYAPATRERIARIGGFLCIAPWSLFILVAATPAVWRSVSGLEAFPETYDPGYFLVKLAMWILVALTLIQATLDLLRPPASE